MSDERSNSDAELMAWDGEGYPPALQPLLARFRDPRWADLWVGRGWWPLLVRLERRLAELDPDFTVSQIKEKFASLRFYVATGPASGAPPAASELTASAGPGGEVGVLFNAAIRDAEIEAAQTCEVCSKPGGMCVSREGSYRTLCADHAGEKYEPVEDEAEPE